MPTKLLQWLHWLETKGHSLHTIRTSSARHPKEPRNLQLCNCPAKPCSVGNRIKDLHGLRDWGKGGEKAIPDAKKTYMQHSVPRWVSVV